MIIAAGGFSLLQAEGQVLFTDLHEVQVDAADLEGNGPREAARVAQEFQRQGRQGLEFLVKAPAQYTALSEQALQAHTNTTGNTAPQSEASEDVQTVSSSCLESDPGGWRKNPGDISYEESVELPILDRPSLDSRSYNSSGWNAFLIKLCGIGYVGLCGAAAYCYFASGLGVQALAQQATCPLVRPYQNCSRWDAPVSTPGKAQDIPLPCQPLPPGHAMIDGHQVYVGEGRYSASDYDFFGY